MRFDLADLRLFLAIVEAGSITHGAQAVNLSVAAASERLRDMEASGGVRLLERGRRGVTPTRAGDTLAHHARLVLHQVGAMHTEMSEYARGLRSSIRVLANTAAITEFLPERLAPWLATHRQVDVDLAERPSRETITAVARGAAAFGIVSDAVDTSPLATLPFALDRLVVVLPRDHPMAMQKRIAFPDMFGEDYVGFAGALQDHIDQQALRVGQRLHLRVRLRTFEGVCRQVAAGVGIGIVPEVAAKRCRRALPIACVRLSDPWATRRLLLCFQEGRPLDPAAQQLLTHLAAGG
jgi:DNA-binding transcriptional LysR family regulator